MSVALGMWGSLAVAAALEPQPPAMRHRQQVIDGVQPATARIVGVVDAGDTAEVLEAQPRLVAQRLQQLQQRLALDEQRELAPVHDDALDRVAVLRERVLQSARRLVEPPAVRLR